MRASEPLTDAEIRQYADTDVCPRCHGQVSLESGHERDSSNDRHFCEKCGWSIGEMSLWAIEDLD